MRWKVRTDVTVPITDGEALAEDEHDSKPSLFELLEERQSL